jgi:flagellar motility protein MotE (MotC chaperone)
MKTWKDAGKLAAAALSGVMSAIVVLTAVGFATRVITVQKLGMIAKVLREEAGTPGSRAGAPKDTAGRYEMEAMDEARRAVQELREQEELWTVKLNERRGDMKKLEADAARIRKELTDRAQAEAGAEKAFREEKAAYAAQLRGEGFKKLVAAFQNMNERDAARLLYGWNNGEAAEVLKALDGDQCAKVIVEIGKRDRLAENSGKEGKAGKLMKSIGRGEPEALTLKAE